MRVCNGVEVTVAMQVRARDLIRADEVIYEEGATSVFGSPPIHIDTASRTGKQSQVPGRGWRRGCRRRARSYGRVRRKDAFGRRRSDTDVVFSRVNKVRLFPLEERTKVHLSIGRVRQLEFDVRKEQRNFRVHAIVHFDGGRDLSADRDRSLAVFIAAGHERRRVELVRGIASHACRHHRRAVGVLLVPTHTSADFGTAGVAVRTNCHAIYGEPLHDCGVGVKVSLPHANGEGRCTQCLVFLQVERHQRRRRASGRVAAHVCLYDRGIRQRCAAHLEGVVVAAGEVGLLGGVGGRPFHLDQASCGDANYRRSAGDSVEIDVHRIDVNVGDGHAPAGVVDVIRVDRVADDTCAHQVFYKIVRIRRDSHRLRVQPVRVVKV